MIWPLVVLAAVVVYQVSVLAFLTAVWRSPDRGHSDCHFELGFRARLRRFLTDSPERRESTDSKAGAAKDWLQPCTFTRTRQI